MSQPRRFEPNNQGFQFPPAGDPPAVWSLSWLLLGHSPDFDFSVLYRRILVAGLELRKGSDFLVAEAGDDNAVPLEGKPVQRQSNLLLTKAEEAAGL